MKSVYKKAVLVLAAALAVNTFAAAPARATSVFRTSAPVCKVVRVRVWRTFVAS